VQAECVIPTQGQGQELTGSFGVDKVSKSFPEGAICGIKQNAPTILAVGTPLHKRHTQQKTIALFMVSKNV